MITAKEISDRLAREAENIARMLLPAGRKMGSEWRAGDTGGESGRSLGVHLTGNKAGVWSDFATGESGDLLDLWAVVRGISLADAIRHAKDYLGIRDPEWTGPRERNFRRPEKPKCQKPVGQVMQYLTEQRKLSLEAVAAYRIGEQPGRVVFPYFRGGELLQVKYLDVERKDGRKVISVEKDCEPCLFGWQAIPPNAREVTICEGEIDAVSLWQLGRPALSVPFGGGKGAKQQWIEYEFDHLARFDTIYLLLDQDREGQIAAGEIAGRLGRHRCKVVPLPAKDANEFLQLGFGAKDLEICYSHAKTLDPAELKSAAVFVEEVIREFYPPDGESIGFAPPWRKTDDKIRFRPGELSIWTGINGHGKSMVLNQVILAAMQQEQKACIASLEIRPRRLLYRLIRQGGGIPNPSQEYIRAAHRWLDGRLWIFDALGTVKGDWILEVFRYARQRYGIQQFVIDSLMKCGIGEDDYNGQKFFVEKLADFKNEHDVHVHLVAHSRKGESEDRSPGKLDVKGTGTITDLADNAFAIWRNKKKEEARRKAEHDRLPLQPEIEEAPDSVLLCDKQRNGDWEGKVGLFWSHESYQLLDQLHGRPRIYIPFEKREAYVG